MGRFKIHIWFHNRHVISKGSCCIDRICGLFLLAHGFEFASGRPFENMLRSCLGYFCYLGFARHFELFSHLLWALALGSSFNEA
jgi:hypothetical protein